MKILASPMMGHKARLKHKFNKYPTPKLGKVLHTVQFNHKNIKRKSVHTYFSERCGKDSDPRNLYKAIRPFYTNKCMNSSCHIQLLENDKIISYPSEISTIMNTNFTRITDNIGKKVDLETQPLDDDGFIKKIILNNTNHPSVKTIKEHSEHQCHFEVQIRYRLS